MKLSALLAVLALVPAGMAPLGKFSLGPDEPTAGEPPKVRTLLMFEKGDAEEAMDFYVSIVPGSKVLDVQRYGPGEPDGVEGTVKLAKFVLGGAEYLCFDTNFDHPFTFTPSMSVYVTCATEAEVDALFAKLTEGGEVYMPLQAYPFSKKFGWCGDRFGVSWQVSWDG